MAHRNASHPRGSTRRHPEASSVSRQRAAAAEEGNFGGHRYEDPLDQRFDPRGDRGYERGWGFGPYPGEDVMSDRGPVGYPRDQRAYGRRSYQSPYGDPNRREPFGPGSSHFAGHPAFRGRGEQWWSRIQGEPYGERDRFETYRGRGPKGWARSDERIRDDISERLYDDPYIDCAHP